MSRDDEHMIRTLLQDVALMPDLLGVWLSAALIEIFKSKVKKNNNPI